MSNRFYLEKYEYHADRLPVIEDIGTLLQISGVVFQGMGSTLIFLSPGAEAPWMQDKTLQVVRPALDEWSEIIRRSDDPKLFIGEAGGINKVIHRKQRFNLSGEVQQKIWARDGFKCMYCGIPMGKRLLTIDHWIPLEQGGANDSANYITACRNDNKDKGMMMPEEFCNLKGYDYAKLKEYMRNV